MKFQEGKFLAKLHSPTIEEQEFFLKVSHENGQHYVQIDDGTRKLVDEDVRNWLLNEVHLIRHLRDDYHPQFRKVRFMIEAQGEYGSGHLWTRTSWEAMEKLLKKFPGLLDAFVTDPYRREWLRDFVRRARELREMKKRK